MPSGKTPFQDMLEAAAHAMVAVVRDLRVSHE